MDGARALPLLPMPTQPEGPPPASRQRVDADEAEGVVIPSDLAELPPEIQGVILGFLANYTAEFENTPDPDPDRVAVPHPRSCYKDSWQPACDQLLGFCATSQAAKEWCKTRLLHTVCEQERAYWARHRPSIPFDDVVKCIKNRDGVELRKTAPDQIKAFDLMAEPPQSGELRTPLAISHVVRARYWYQRYVANIVMRAMPPSVPVAYPFYQISNYLAVDASGRAVSTRRWVVQVVAFAQLLVRLQDEWAANESIANDAAYAVERALLSQYDQPGVRPAVSFLAAKYEIHMGVESGLPQASPAQAAFIVSHPAERTLAGWIQLAKTQLERYGPPDTWSFALFPFNGSPIKFTSTFEGAFLGSFGVTEQQRDLLERLMGGTLICPTWHMGLYELRAVTSMKATFEFNRHFDRYIGGWNVSNVVNFERMFASSNYNGPLNDWDVSRATKMNEMFSVALKFNRPLDKWFLPFLSSANDMFHNSYAFNQAVDTWATNTGAPTNPRGGFLSSGVAGQVLQGLAQLRQCRGMFSFAQAFDQPVPNLASRIIQNNCDSQLMFYSAVPWLRKWEQSKKAGREAEMMGPNARLCVQRDNRLVPVNSEDNCDLEDQNYPAGNGSGEPGFLVPHSNRRPLGY